MADEDGGLTVGEWLERIVKAEAEGDLLQAADQAADALREHPGVAELQYHHLLSLSRSGGLTEAERLWPLYRLPQDDTNYAALGARLLRERGFAAGGAATAEGRAALLAAGNAYERVFRQGGSPFPAINAAVMNALGGRPRKATTLARAVLRLVGEAVEDDAGAAFNLAADEATASLILGDEARAAAAIERLLAKNRNASAYASTRRQLKQLVAALGRGAALVERLTPRASLHYTGHMIAAPDQPGRFPAEAEAAVARDLEAALDRLQVGAGFGSLASGADILVAESLFRRGIPYTVVLPFDRQSFLEVSVAPAGGRWPRRFARALERASQVVQATEGPYLGDAAVFAYTTRLAMGLARLRARIEDAESHQLAVWDGDAGNGVAGTAHDLAAWRSLGLPSTVIDSRPRRAKAKAKPAARRAAKVPTRTLRAFLFGDFRGFGRLDERELLAFNRRVLPTVARILDRFEPSLEIRHTWGDGLYLVFDDVGVAATAALALQAGLEAIDRPAAGLPASLGLRAALHAGPVHAVYDPVMRQQAYTGRHISRAARMEPVTPEGQVYVSDAFAALLALQPEGAASYEYVGRVPLAKKAGHLRMYLLRRGS